MYETIRPLFREPNLTQPSTERARRCHNGEVQGSHQRTSMCCGTFLHRLTRDIRRLC